MLLWNEGIMRIVELAKKVMLYNDGFVVCVGTSRLRRPSDQNQSERLIGLVEGGYPHGD